jgi:hypothetical protein
MIPRETLQLTKLARKTSVVYAKFLLRKCSVAKRTNGTGYLSRKSNLVYVRKEGMTKHNQGDSCSDSDRPLRANRLQVHSSSSM